MAADVLTRDLLSAGIIYFVMAAAALTIVLVVWYIVIKAAVRNGTIEAYEKMGIDSGNNNGPYGQ